MNSATEDELEDEPGDEISLLEARLEHLAEIAERCRKIILGSQIAIGAGAVLLLLMLFGLFGSIEGFLGAIAAILGGIVSLGSNVSTLQQTTDAIGAAEAQRSDLISRIELRVVDDSPLKLV